MDKLGEALEAAVKDRYTSATKVREPHAVAADSAQIRNVFLVKAVAD
jgi:hypothetical protein